MQNIQLCAIFSKDSFLEIFLIHWPIFPSHCKFVALWGKPLEEVIYSKVERLVSDYINENLNNSHKKENELYYHIQYINKNRENVYAIQKFIICQI